MNDSLSVFVEKNLAIRKAVKAEFKAAEENPVTNEELRALLDNPNDERRYVGIKTEKGAVVVSFLFCRTMLTGVEDKDAFDERVAKVIEESQRLRLALSQGVYGFHRPSKPTEPQGNQK